MNEQTSPPGAPDAPGGAPLVTLDWSVMWCARHLEPYRPAWPAGAPVAMLKLFQAAAAMPTVADAAHGDATQLSQALVRFAPVCCFVGSQVLDEIYAATLPQPS